ncbi:uncharacterized protein LOC143582408 [Bidens hawaiensis]|uniref:uncharacterized protein LOC143582408 n=1 Tax=Bidens hawaiensis TaxID=980011 RepID=UPI004048F76C
MVPKKRNTRSNPEGASPMSLEAIDQLVAQRVASAIAQYETNRNGNNGSGSGTGGNGTGGNGNGIGGNGTGTGEGTESGGTGEANNNEKGCSYKTFLSCNPRIFHETEGAIGIIRWIEKMESVLSISNCATNFMVRYATCTLEDEAQNWWNSQVQTLGMEAVHQLTWEELKAMVLEEYCPRSELQKIETELWDITMTGSDVTAYTTRFQELARLVPHMVSPEYKRIEKYIWGLVPQIRSLVTSSRSTTFKSTVTLSHSLTDEAVRMGTLPKKSSANKKDVGEKKETDEKKVGDKRKWVGKYNNPNYKLHESAKAYMATTESKGYAGNKPKCNKCARHHHGKCNMCGNADKGNQGCYEYGSPNHFKKNCPKLINNNYNNQARGRAFVIGTKDARQDPSTVTVTFLFNGHYAYVLFDTGADLSFVSTKLRPLLGIESNNLKDKYTIELGNGKLIESSEVVQGCTLALEGHSFEIDLLPVDLGSFDIVVVMDWLSKNRAEIVCFEKVVRLPLPNGEVLVVQGERKTCTLKIISCMKARKFLRKGYQEFLAHVVEKELDERRLEDIPIVRDYPDVFPMICLGYHPIEKLNFVLIWYREPHRLHVHHIDWHHQRCKSYRHNYKSC